MFSARTVLVTALSATLSAAQAHAAPMSVAQAALEQASAATTVQAELLQMASQAGIIFAGEVLSVTPRPSFTPGSGTVEIAFRVDQPVRGCDGLSTYTLREWAGLWTAGHQRYIPGQRLLILLHTPSASGLSSPVGGQEGVLPITGAGTAPRPNDTFVAQSEPAVDLRWVQARLPRATVLSQNSRFHSFAGSPQAVTATRKGLLRSINSAPNSAPIAGPSAVESPNTLPLSAAGSHGISLRGILAILGAWQAQQNNASH